MANKFKKKNIPKQRIGLPKALRFTPPPPEKKSLGCTQKRGIALTKTSTQIFPQPVYFPRSFHENFSEKNVY